MPLEVCVTELLVTASGDKDAGLPVDLTLILLLGKQIWELQGLP